MVTDDIIPPAPMSQAELANSPLASARAESVFFKDQPVQQLDLFAAARAVDAPIRLRSKKGSPVFIQPTAATSPDSV
jgi:hypothetical protein